MTVRAWSMRAAVGLLVVSMPLSALQPAGASVVTSVLARPTMVRAVGPGFRTGIDLSQQANVKLRGSCARADHVARFSLRAPASGEISIVARAGGIGSDPALSVRVGNEIIACNDDRDRHSTDAAVTMGVVRDREYVIEVGAASHQVGRVEIAVGNISKPRSGRTSISIQAPRQPAAAKFPTAWPTSGISGVVRDAATGAPARDVCASIDGGYPTPTSPTGAYTLELPSGEYRVHFSVCPYQGGEIPRYRTSYWSASGRRDEPGDLITVAPFAITRDINARMVRAGAIGGVIVDARHGAPVVGACVHALRTGHEVGSTLTSITGAYTIAQLTPGDYSIRVDDCDLQTNPFARDHPRFVAQYYGGQTVPPGTSVSVRAWHVTHHIDVRVAVGRAIAGFARDAVTGEPLGGICVAAYLPSGVIEQVVSSPTMGYRLTNLPASNGGRFKVGFSDCLSVPPNWNATFYDNALDFEHARFVETKPDFEVTKINGFLRTTHVPPPNDDIANAIVLAGPGGSLVAHLMDATTESGEPIHGVSGDGTAGSVWYSFVAPANGALSVQDYGCNGGTAIYSGSAIASLTSVDSGFCPIVAPVVAGQRYSIAVTDPYQQSTLAVDWHFDVAPPNDDFVNAVALNGTSGALSGSFLGATAEPGEPDHSPFSIGPVSSVWFRYVAPANGLLTLQSSSCGEAIAVYTGTAVSALTPVSSAVCGASASLLKGQTYSIAVDVAFRGLTSFSVTWSFA